MNAPAPAGRLPVLATERVLSTLNVDGTRRWIRPRPSPGRFHRRRRALAWALIAMFVLLPYLRIGGRPAILLDLPRREFSLFGGVFLATDTLLFMLLFVSAVIAIFLVTSLFGRVWCGWACPQTVYLEFVFRPIERWIEGGFRGSLALDRARGLKLRRWIKLVVYVPIAMLLAHVFLAYFVGVERLAQWVQRSPIEHPTTFLLMLGTTALVFFDFAYFREQTCLVACPYGRLQSVLLDRRSLIVGYDVARGEPRGKGVKTRAAGAGDCVDCQMCVLTCPTGIDIRQGLQMECIHCTQCMDACDAVMDKIGRPRGLIRYSARDELAGKASSWVRPRVLLYPMAMVASIGLFLFVLGTKSDTDVTILRGGGAPFQLATGDTVLNQLRVKITNRGDRERRYQIELRGAPTARLIVPINPFPVPAGQVRTAGLFVAVPRSALHEGELPVSFSVSEGDRFRADIDYELVGPEESEHEGATEGPAPEDEEARGR